MHPTHDLRRRVSSLAHGLARAADVLLDRTVVLGYGRPGLAVRRFLPGWPADPPDMTGRTVLVTGAASGIGLAAAVGFARLNATVFCVGRDPARAARAVGLALEQVPGADLRPVACDVADIAAVRAFTGTFRHEVEHLDVLVANAGVMPDERTLSADGVELMFATHVVGPWLLVDGLGPILDRVVMVTSGGQYGQAVPPGDVESAGGTYGPKKVYARTKRAQLILVQEWARRLTGRVHVHAMHPGWADTKGVRSWMPVFRWLTLPVIRTPEEGADTIVWLGGSPEGGSTSGLLWHDRRPRPAVYALSAGPDDEAVRREVWEHVVDLVGFPSVPAGPLE